MNLFTPPSPLRSYPTWDLNLLSQALLLDRLSELLGSELSLDGRLNLVWTILRRLKGVRTGSVWIKRAFFYILF